jgi:hypothetical protein
MVLANAFENAAEVTDPDAFPCLNSFLEGAAASLLGRVVDALNASSSIDDDRGGR